jgi:2-polyprenyl-3-methyl-5-hydroxy-6-metoxy-1,4-benzoquinol methylase
MIRPDGISEARRALRGLARAVGRRCRGRTLVLGGEFPELMERLASQGIEALARPLAELTVSGGASRGSPEGLDVGAGSSFDTVVLYGAVEYAGHEDAPGILQRVWRLMAERGRLLVCVPHGDHVRDPAVRQRFTRHALKRLMKTIDQPKVLTDQPYRWLLMYVDSEPGVNRATNERYRVVAALCRGRVLELGCGAGHLCRSIADAGLTVTGVDKNAAKIAKARRSHPGIDFTQADILTLSLEERYDTVVLAEVLEHVTADVGDRMLSRGWELVAPGGRLIVSVPNEDCVRHANHVREFTEADFLELLGARGQPQIVADQPFQWLLGYVDRPA